jgi:hypothetical protein
MEAMQPTLAGAITSSQHQFTKYDHAPIGAALI